MPLNTPLLDTITTPDDVRKLSPNRLPTLAGEVRDFMIDSVSKTGGHLGSGLGVVELTTALHYVFNTPHDKIIWDVGHQAYPHKILTGRKDQMHTLRQGGGLSGFTERAESEYDPFGAAHSSTSISAGLGMAVASTLNNDPKNVVAVIGDGAMSAGMAFEAMNNAGANDQRLIVILNDNDMSIAPPVGAMSAYLSRMLSGKTWISLRNLAKDLATKLPKSMEHLAERAEEYARTWVTGGTLFEELGFYYIGPVDGHNLDHLLPVLENVRDMPHNSPVLIHVVTEKGKGYNPAEQSHHKYHGVTQFDVTSGKLSKSVSNSPSFTNIFAEQLIKHAEQDDKIVAITAAMPSGTGLDSFASQFPTRTFDVGIAEQHAVTFAGGMACEGAKPFVAIYSTFLQRAYDQIIHDIDIQNLPVRFAIDRAGYVGADGKTHCGAFDIAYLSILPNMMIMCPADEAELCHAIATAVDYNDSPCAFRYPRGTGMNTPLPEIGTPMAIGRGRIVQSAVSRLGRAVKTADVALLSLGTRLESALSAHATLTAQGITATVADARFAKPLDTDLITDLAKTHKLVVTIEEGCKNGFGASVTDILVNNDLSQKTKIRTLTMPDDYINHDSQPSQHAQAGLDADGIVATVLSALK